MSYVSLPHVATGDLATAADQNTFLDDVAILRVGGIAIASQATKDFIYATSSEQLGRLAAVANSFPYYDGANWTMKHGAGAVLYTPTLLDATNTISEIAILNFDVPPVSGVSWGDGEQIWVVITGIGKNNKGSAGTPLAKVNVGAGAQVSLGVGAWPDSANEYKFQRGLVLQRNGATVNVIVPPTSRAAPITQWSDDPSQNYIAGTSTPANFTSTITVSLKVTLDAANAAYYWKLLTGGCAQVIHFRT